MSPMPASHTHRSIAPARAGLNLAVVAAFWWLTAGMMDGASARSADEELLLEQLQGADSTDAGMQEYAQTGQTEQEYEETEEEYQGTEEEDQGAEEEDPGDEEEDSGDEEEDSGDEEEDDSAQSDTKTPSAEELINQSQDLATPPGSDTPNANVPIDGDDSSTTTSTTDEDLTTRIRKLGETVGTGGGSTVTTTDEDDDITVTDDGDTTITDDGPTVYGEELDDEEFCCGLKGNLLTYPIVKDPMELSKELEAPRAVATGAFQVLLHNGAYFHNELDISVRALSLPIEWSRHWKGKLKFTDGGLMGHGWDFAYNKRIVPIAARTLATGLFAEQLGAETPQLIYFNGQDRGEQYVEAHSERRKVRNFDAAFEAYVTTYQSPPGQFHEIERYVLLDGATGHPFGEHPNVEKTERIFYVLRDKNGTRYVFNCRGQLIYILSRNHSPKVPIRVELRYAGALNPLTHNPMLSEIIDATNRKFSVDTVFINQSVIFTNIECKPVRGTLPVPRIKRVTGAGLGVEYSYRGGDTEPVLEKVTIDTGDTLRIWRYGYDGENRLVSLTDPNEGAKGTGGKPYLTNTYDGEGRVVTQQLGDMRLSLNYQGNGVEVRDSKNTLKRYALKKISNFFVIVSSTITGDGGSWTTRYDHNDATQVTRITYPRGNGIAYTYDGGNEPVTLGPIRDWVDKDLTYENNLTQGNLLTVSLFDDKGAAGASTNQAYEPLYNQMASASDPLGRKTSYFYDYDTPKNRGNPVKVQEPPVLQPGGGSVARNPVIHTYNRKGQVQKTDLGDGRVTSYDYDAKGYLKQMTFPSGATTSFEVDLRGDVLSETTPEGVVSYARDGAGRVTERKVNPGKDETSITYRYDPNGNVIETRVEIVDAFDRAKAGERGVTDQIRVERVVTSKYDIINRLVEERVSSGPLQTVTQYAYGPTGALESITAPSMDGTGPFVTRLAYDARGLVTEETTAAGTPAELVTRYEYDANGNMDLTEKGSGEASALTTTSYDGFDRVQSFVDPEGAEHTMSLDAAGQIKSVEITGAADEGGAPGTLFRVEYEYNGYGDVMRKSVDSLRGEVQETLTFRNAHLQITRVRGPNGGEQTFEYDLENRITRAVDPIGNETRNTYDSKGNLTQTEQIVEEQVFDNGSRTYRPQRQSTITAMTYDGFGRVTGLTAPGVSQEMFYNSAGQIRGIWSRGEGTASFEYDGLGRKVLSRSAQGFERRRYTPAGFVVGVETKAGNISYVLDAFGRATQETNSRTKAVTRTKYDVLGRAIDMTDPNNTKVTRAYSPTGLVKSVSVQVLGGMVVNGGGWSVPAVSGVTSEEFVYDALGRVLRARTNQGSDVRFDYDGLGRIVEETQIYGSYGQTLRHSYEPDGSSDELQYPELAGRAVLRRNYDKLGRITSIAFDGKKAVDYLYTGMDRIARKTYGNQVQTRYAFDERQRLQEMTLVDPFAGRGNDVLWTTRASYDGAWLTEITEVTQPHGDKPGSVMKTTMTRGPDHVVIGSLTTRSTLATASQPQTITKSGMLTTYADGRVSQIAEFIADDLSGALNMARTDEFTYNSAGRVDQVRTRGEAAINATDIATATVEDIQSFLTARGGAVEGTQKFQYDNNGNILTDGRFIFSYDYKNRLVRIADIWAPYRYNEALFFYYDAFDRRVYAMPYRDRAPIGMVRWGPEWVGAGKWFLYDQHDVVAEAWVNHPKVPGTPAVLLARYVPGAREGERIRMDRRPEGDPTLPLVTYYLHEDIQGGLRTVSDTEMGVRQVQKNEPGPGESGSDPEAPPGDGYLIEGTGIRLPYIGAATRVDGLAGTVYREDIGQVTIDFRSAHEFAKLSDRKAFRDNATAYQNRMLAVMGLVGAAPIVAPYMIAAGPLAIKGALLAGTLSVTFSAYAAYHTQSGYSLEEAAGNFAHGALAGALGGTVASLGFGLIRELAVDYVVSVGTNTLLTVASSGASFGDALSQNAVSGIKDAALGFAVGRISVGLSGLSNRIMARVQQSGSVMRSQGPKSEGIDPTKGLWSRWTSYMDKYARWMDFHTGKDMLPRGKDQRALEGSVIHELMSGTPISKEIGRRLASGEFELRFSKFGDPNVYGEVFVQMSRKVIHINIETLPRNPRTGKWGSRQVAGTVVHEGVHLLGGGELSAHIGQAQFLNTRLVQSSRPPRGIELKQTDHPMFDSYHIEFINTFRRSKDVVVDIAEFISGGYKPHRVALARDIGPDQWIVQQGGFGKALGIKSELFDILEANAPKYGMR